MTATPAPVTIDVDRDHGVTLTWADGTTSEFGLEELRQQCPCAECRTAARSRSARLAVALLAATAADRRREARRRVGIGITWNDGHATGIYSWGLLRPDRPV
jgi:DUF971 family protein